MPYVGSWLGSWRVPLSANSVAIGLNLVVNDCGEGYTGTAQRHVNGVQVIGTLTASIDDSGGGDILFNAVITWESPYGTSKFIGTGGVHYVVAGEVLHTVSGKTTRGVFNLQKNG